MMNFHEQKLLGLEGHGNPHVIYQASGCIFCDSTGYKGRLAVVEAVCFDEDMDEIIARRGTRHDLLRHALTCGFRTLARVGAERVLDGSTSMDEMSRVIDMSCVMKRNSDDASLSIPRH